jgi:L-amino acid N-acyltransferase YncA
MDERSTRVTRPDGTSLTIRPATGGDVEAIMALYASLSADDRRRRFFTLSYPRRELVERFIEATARDGLWLVAVSDDGEIVADGGYSRLPDGDAELALTVRPDWRGGLGSTLFDAIRHDAEQHGVDNLRADILRENRPMLRIIEQQGYASIDQPDWMVVEATLSTHGGRPGWPRRHARRRLLVEECGGRWHADAQAWAAGWDVITCPGPGARSVGPCPLLEGGRCPLVDGADAVVVVPRVDDPHRSELVAAHRRSTPAPVLDEATAAPHAVTALLESARDGGGRGGDGDVIRLDVDDARDLADHGLDEAAVTGE